MKVGELYEFLKNAIEEGKIDLEADVIADGEYGYGEALGRPFITEKSYLRERTIAKDTVTVLALPIDTYLYECEDLGYSCMWVEPGEANELKEEWDSYEEDEE